MNLIRPNYKTTLMALSAIVFNCAVAFSQGVPTQPSKSPKPFVKVKGKGWRLSDLRDARLRAREELRKVGDGSATLYLSVLEAGGKAALLLDAPRPILSEVIRRYDVDGKVFCYYYSGVCLGLHKEKGKKYYVPLGCTTAYAFYDEDGDGKFERLESFLPSFFDLRVPAYLLKKRSSG